MQPQEPQSPVPQNQVPEVPQNVQPPAPDANVPAEPEVHNPLRTMQPGEKFICEIKRHPIGLIGLYASVGLILLLIATFGYGLGTSLFTDASKSQIYTYTTLGLVVAGLLSAVALIVGHIVYWGNRWIITSDSVTQISQLTPFNVQSSQLSMANIEDVTSEKSGLFPFIFNYGSLKAETAGERQKFKLLFCPDPDRYAKIILQAREEFEQEHYRLSTNGGNINQRPQ